MILPEDRAGVQMPASPGHPPDALTSAPLTLIPENIPEVLRSGKRFVAWRYETRKGQLTKVPYSPNATKGASSTAPADWVTFETAEKYANVAGLDGIGIVVTHEAGLTWFDLDHCHDPATGEVAEWAAAIVRRCDTYTEISPSGTGLRLAMYGTLPPHGRKKGDVEMYGAEAGKTGPCGRYLTLTGRRLDGTPSALGYRPDAILAIHREVFGAEATVTATVRDPDLPVTALEIADDEVIRLASTSSHNGARFLRLWDGDSSDYAVDGNDGESEADAAFFEILGFYGGPDPERIERLARRSNRVREKWDRQKDYLKRSINFAIRGKTRFYGDSVQVTPAPVVGSDGAEGCLDCPETLRLRGLLLDRDDLIESLFSANGTLSIKLTQIQELRALERQMELDKQRIRRKLKPMQAESVIAVATIGPAMANSAGVATPYVTREAIAHVAGGKPATVGANLHVLDYPGSPVTRVTVPKGQKSLTAYDFAGMDTPDLLRALADFAEGLEVAPKLTPERVRCERCPTGTTQTSAIICDGCSKVLVRKHLPGPNVQENSTLEATAGTVSVRTYRAGKQHVGPRRFAEDRPQRADKQRVDERAATGVIQPGWLDQWPDALTPPDDPLPPPDSHAFDVPEVFRQ